jgi:U3 small nucleolar RNA-associated protein 21
LSCVVKVAVEELRLPPILSFAAVETRSRDWANVITCHEGHSHAYVWKFDQRVIGQVHTQATMKELSTPCMRQGKVENHDLSRAFYP